MARNREFDTDEVLDKAVELFWRRGYNGVSTQELIDDFGISKSSMYGAFGDKMLLYITALDRYQKKAISLVIKSFEESQNIKNEIRKLLENTAKNAMVDENHKGCFIVNSSIELAPHNIKVADLLRMHREMLGKILSKFIKKGIESGEFSKEKNPEVLSRLICCVISGIEADSKFIEDVTYFNSIIDALMLNFD